MKIYFFITFIFLFFLSWGQNSFESGFTPKIGINTKYKKWKFQGVYLSEHRLHKRVQNELVDNQYKHKKTTTTLVVTHKIGVFSKLGIGYGYNFISHAHAITQQYTYTKKGYRQIFGHRFRIDQQFKEGQLSRIRARYRFSITNPLNGAALDPKEFYLKYAIENLLIWKNDEVDIDNRNGLSLGYYISGSDKLELGVLFKAEHLLSTYQNIKLWSTFSWYVSLNKRTKKKKIIPLN